MCIWIVVGTAAVLAISATVAVTLGRMITHADQRETSQQWNICCTGCALQVVDTRTPTGATIAQTEWSHTADEDYCPDCTATRHSTWGY